MTVNTLFLLQSEFAKTSTCLEQLIQISTPQDPVVLLGEAVLFAQDQRLQQFTSVYVLETEIDLIPDNIKTQIKVLSYLEFSDLVLDFKHCMSLK